MLQHACDKIMVRSLYYMNNRHTFIAFLGMLNLYQEISFFSHEFILNVATPCMILF